MKNKRVRKILIFSLILQISVNFLEARKIVKFQVDFKSPEVFLDEYKIYLFDPILMKFAIDDRKDFRKISEFGKRGQGPAEFMTIGNVIITDDFIFVNSYPKLCVFSTDGKLIKELRGPANCGGFIPIGQNFIGSSYPPIKKTDEKTKIQFSLFDSELKKKKDIYLGESGHFSRIGGKKMIVYWIRDYTGAEVYKDRLYIGETSKGFHFSVFDSDGKKLYEINRAYEKRRVTEADKRSVIDGIKKMSKNFWNWYNANHEIIFRDYYPAFEYFCVTEDRIYVFQYPKDGKYELLVLDLNGNLIKQLSIPKNILGRVGKYNNCIHGGKLYRIEENEEEEVWELHEYDIFNQKSNK